MFGDVIVTIMKKANRGSGDDLQKIVEITFIARYGTQFYDFPSFFTIFDCFPSEYRLRSEKGKTNKTGKHGNKQFKQFQVEDAIVS